MVPTSHQHKPLGYPNIFPPFWGGGELQHSSHLARSWTCQTLVVSFDSLRDQIDISNYVVDPQPINPLFICHRLCRSFFLLAVRTATKKHLDPVVCFNTPCTRDRLGTSTTSLLCIFPNNTHPKQVLFAGGVP